MARNRRPSVPPPAPAGCHRGCTYGFWERPDGVERCACLLAPESTTLDTGTPDARARALVSRAERAAVKAEAAAERADRDAARRSAAIARRAAEAAARLLGEGA